MIRGWGDLRLAPAAVAAWASSLIVWGGGAAWACASVAWLIAGVLALAPGTRAALPLAALGAVAGTAAALTAHAAVGSRAWIDASAGHAVEVAGRVAEVRTLEGDAAEARTAVRVDASAWRPPGRAWAGGRGVVVVIVPASDAPPRGGDAVARGVLTAASRGTADALLDGGLVEVSPPAGWRAGTEGARAAFLRVLAGVDGATTGVVAGMVLGDTSAMPATLVEQLRTSGLAHLTAVSGAHFAILAAALGGALRRARASPWVVAAATVTACGALAVTVSGGGSVLRALAMAAIAAGALVAGRRGQSMPALCAVVVVLIVLRPELARDAGLALSVAAVVAITQLAPALSSRLRRRFAAPVADAAAVTLAAQAACLPVLALIDGSVGPWAVAANAVATPFAVPVTLLGVSALVVAAPLPGLAAALAGAAAWCAWPVVLAARAFARAPGGDASSAVGTRGLLLGCALLLATVGLARSRGMWWGLSLGLAMVAGLLLHAPPRWLPEPWGGAVDGWSIVACDVGQGDALVVRSRGAMLMVDVGPGGDAAAACLARLGVTRVDLLVLSHEHADHTGGLAAVRAEVDIGRVWLPPAPSDATVAAVAGLHAEAPVAGASEALGGLTVEVLQTGPAPRTRDGTDVNDSSTALRVTVDGLTLIALGDLEVGGQARLARAADLAGTTVAKVAHHGSAAQDAALIREIGAAVALVSVGAGNDYGHPAPEALALYGGAGAVVLRTDLCGDVVLGTRDGAPVLVRPCRSAVGR
ncbi:ComEC/Rec2 family competence protein [Demequina iriomotensis]|uniref:ComEC/Rec2 family competence protein n=1 Tax=Demequina iriomotensis TaxID=1536641 RepID=UPI0007834F5E|nr:ComEC/Rec2 family competence protein [Demequina iriomotensis]